MAGAKVFATGTNLTNINKLNQKNQNSSLEYLQLNLKNPENVKSFIKDTLANESVDILINNAGINIVADATDIVYDDFQRFMKLTCMVLFC